MRIVTTILTMFLLTLPLAGRAQNGPVVIELFTSQGCSSCPPADTLLQELGQRDDVLALALHVDYWDYLGWQDHFASRAFTNRQKAYAHVGKRRTVFTPEIVVQGQDSIVGHKRDYIVSAIAQHKAAMPLVRISVERDDTGLTISIAPTGENAPAADLLLVRFVPDEEVMINSGENAGKTILYTNIVRSVERLATWDGQSENSLRIEAVDGRAAVIAQERNYGPILTAVRVE
jgi:hypothetical protein